MNLSSLLADVEYENPEPASSSPAPAPVRPRAVRPMDTPSAPISEADLKLMIGEARRDVRKQSGLIGQAMNRLRGDDLQRRQYASLLRRIDAWDATEEAKLAVFLIASLSVLGFQVAVSALHEMETYLERFPMGSAAQIAGQRMLDHKAQELPATIETVMQRAQRGQLRPFGLDR